MRFVADLHVHSSYSRATSRDMTPPFIDRAARLKGIGVVGTGDCIHPGWRACLDEQLEPAEQGLYRLRSRHRLCDLPAICDGDPRFLCSTEISCIFRRAGKTRRIHLIVLLPGLEAARRLGDALGRRGNILADGRPILGIDATVLCDIVFDTEPDAVVVPAHAWTPHFSVFGALSGFDSIDECFASFAPRIKAIETGLSSDPPMNRRVSALDGITLLSNSDAHSPANLGREATVFDVDLSYDGIAAAIATGSGVAGTIEFFPQEGKYYFDGHRACGVALPPEETRRLGGGCPVCGKQVTTGVLQRVEALADRARPALSGSFAYAVPLREILAEQLGKGITTAAVGRSYGELIARFGTELAVLLELPLDEINRAGQPGLAEAIGRMRCGEAVIDPGYDGRYGVVRLSAPPEGA